MSAQVSIEFDKVALQRAIDGLEKTKGAIGLTVQWLVWDCARMTANNCIKYVAPWASGKPGNTKEQKESGEKAIGAELLGSGDARGLFAAMDGSLYSSDRGNWSRKAPGYSLLRNKAGAVWLVDTDYFRPSATDGDLKQFHIANRTSGGHVSRSKNKGSNDRRIGRWKASNKMFAPSGVVKSYVKSVQKRVGSLKAGWLPSADYFAKLTNGKVSAPAWVRRHDGIGTYSNGVSEDGDGSVVLTNTSHHCVGIRPGFAPFIEGLSNKYIQEWLPQKIDKVCERFNASRADGKAVTA